MKKAPIICLSISVIILFETVILAQVASPHLDVTKIHLNPAASGWRNTSTVASGYYLEDAEIEYPGGSDQDESITTSAVFFILTSNSEKAVFEVGANQDRQIYRYRRSYSGTYPTPYTALKEEKYCTTTNNYHINLAKAVIDNISFGVAIDDTHLKIDAESSQLTTSASETAESDEVGKSDTLRTSKLQLGISLKLYDVLYFGYMLSQIKKSEYTFSITSNTKTYDLTGKPILDRTNSGEFTKLGNEWDETTYAVGIHIGEKRDRQFRLEYYKTTSPLSFIESKNDKNKNIHGETEETGIIVEYKQGKILFNVGGKIFESVEDFVHSTGSSSTTYDEELNTSEVFLGFGLINSDGLSVSLYGIKSEEKQYDTGHERIKLEYTGYSIRLGYSF